MKCLVHKGYRPYIKRIQEGFAVVQSLRIVSSKGQFANFMVILTEPAEKPSDLVDAFHHASSVFDLKERGQYSM